LVVFIPVVPDKVGALRGGAALFSADALVSIPRRPDKFGAFGSVCSGLPSLVVSILTVPDKVGTLRSPIFFCRGCFGLDIKGTI
jgi:hypothetical protein